MTTNGLIPKPQWSRSKIREGPVWELCKAIPGWTQATFHAFKKHIRFTENTSGLDKYCEPQDQDQTKWQKLLNDCLREFPELNNFDGHWPLDIYYRKLVYVRVVQRRHREKQAAAAAALNSVQPTTMNSKKRKIPRPQRPDEDGEEDIGSTRSAAARSIEPAGKQCQRLSQPQDTSTRRGPGNSLETRNGRSDNDPGSSTGPCPGAPSLSRNATRVFRPKELQPVHREQKRHWFIFKSAKRKSMLQLERTVMITANTLTLAHLPDDPERPAGDEIEGPLAMGFECVDDNDLLARLANAGVVADHHLRALLRLNESCQEACLHALASAEKLTWVEMIQIADALETYLDHNPYFNHSSNPEPARKARLTVIRRPPEGLENILARHTCRYGYLKKHLGVADDAEYFELVDLVERLAPRYLDTSRSFEKQDPEQINALVTAVCKVKPSARKYDACWAVKLHIRRFLSARADGLSFTPRENAAVPGDLPPTPPAHEHKCPGLTLYPASSVPPVIAALLSDFGMEELGPAFVSLGFTSDAKFANIVASRRAKENFVDKLPAQVLKCSAFQVFMLKNIIESA
ncbi:hypothetical protein MSAN_00645000 [Mycena sanguinolenta]|uniref:Uncharacterized protein n=1 Tax=Mycena sanguinolenta TaxID=230812 RepID=A0A8H6Z3R8_9AGAR|nr:hypothetical protein MSAN_00645000 [Mycena sanguinolenta]